MVSLRICPGIPGKLRNRLRGSVKPIRRGIVASLAFTLSTLLTFLGCLFAAEVALGRRVTRRDPEPQRGRGKSAPEGEPLLPPIACAPTALPDAPAGRGVEFFAQPQGECPVLGGRSPIRRAPGLANGFSRCVHFPRCRHRHAASRCSQISVQEWLKLNQSPGSSSHHRRHRAS
jgi:hypothetical protein